MDLEHIYTLKIINVISIFKITLFLESFRGELTDAKIQIKFARSFLELHYLYCFFRITQG